MVFHTLRYKCDAIIAHWEALCKRAKRLRVPLPPKPTFRDLPIRSGKPAETEVKIENKPIGLAGWRFVAKVDFEGGPNPVVYVLPGESFRFTRRKDKNGCDHCGHIRDRHNCYIVKKGKKVMQVGSTCLKDFLGHNPLKATHQIDILAALSQEPGDEYYGERMPELLLPYLTMVSLCISRYGWTSRKAADLHGIMATADQAQFATDEMSPKPKKAEMDKSRELAEKAMRHASRLPKGEVFTENLRAIAENGHYTHTQIGIAAYIVQHYILHLESKNKVGGYVGEVGKRMTFDLTCQRTNTFQGQFGVTTLYTFQDKDGNTVVWFSTTDARIAPQQKVRLIATVKEHSEYRGVKQTVVTRAKVS